MGNARRGKYLVAWQLARGNYLSWLKILGYKAFLWVLGSNFSNFVILGLRWFMFLEKIKDFLANC